MLTKKDIAEAYLTLYFYSKQEYEKANQKCFEIEHEMSGLKSPNLTGEHGTPEDRQHKLIRLGEKLKPYENDMHTYDVETKHYYQMLHLSKLDDIEMRVLEYKYFHKFTGDEIAMEIGYNGRKYVSRKIDNILTRIAEGM